MDDPGPQDIGLKIEQFMDVVYKCKFCPYTCSQSPEMGHHVKQHHLTQKSSTSCSFVNQLDQSCSISDTPNGTVNHIVVESSPIVHSVPSKVNTKDQNVITSSTAPMVQTDDLLGFSDQSQVFVDKSLTDVPYASFAVPVSVCNGEPVTLSSNSTPDLTDLINLVKPSSSGGKTASQPSAKTEMCASNIFSPVTNANKSNNISSNSVEVVTIGQYTQQVKSDLGDSANSCLINKGGSVDEGSDLSLRNAPAGLEIQVTGPPAAFFEGGMLAAAADNTSCDISQPYTVMAIQIPNLGPKSSSSVPQYVLNPPLSDQQSMPFTADTKEFLLCGLCKLAFTTMEDCHAHMQLEHRELMQDSGVSIGVQVGGAKRGRKRKSEHLKKVKEEPTELNTGDDDDTDWLPSMSEPSTHTEGRTRRHIKPPRALKEDYVLSRRTRRKDRESGSDDCYKLNCPMMGCKAKLKTAEGLRIHVECHNMNDSALTCKECHAPHEFWKNLRLHMWKKHKIDCDLYTCETCNYKTDTRYKMSIHMEIHSDSKPYTCDVCGKGFRQASQMKNHQVLHSKSDLIQLGTGWHQAKKCEICDRVFANSKCLKKHKEVVHGNHKPYACTFCNHKTARKAMMELHMRTHTGEKPFKCDICKYSTGDHNSLRRHKMRHTGQKQYRCTQCPYTCIQSISLKQHMRHKHPGTTAGIFQCSRCPFRSINQTIYYAHMQDHKKGLIPDKFVHPRVELPKARKAPMRSQTGILCKDLPSVSSLLLKHPQLHAVMPGDNSSSNNSVAGEQALPASNLPETEAQVDIFNMQVTMLAGGDTQISAEDMTRLSEYSGLASAGTTALQLIYDTLATLANHTEPSDGQSTLLTAQLPGGVHTAVLSSLQGDLTVHNITYHLPRAEDGAAASVVSRTTSATDVNAGVS